MLIDRDAAIDAAIEGAEADGNYSLEREESIEEYVMRVPVVDAVVVVRCRDCKHYNTTGCNAGFGWCEDSVVNTGTCDDFYCARGERRDEDD